MEIWSDLWLPVLLSGVFVFIVSSLLHMVIPIHKGDAKKLPQEEKVLDALRSHGVGPGMYLFPCPGSMKEMSSPEMKKKYETGPVGFMTVVPSGTPRIGKSLMLWFLYGLLVAFVTAYITKLGLGRGAETMTVFRMSSAAAILAFAFYSIPESIWRGQSWTVTLKFMFDGIIYGIVTGATLAWLWPA